MTFDQTGTPAPHSTIVFVLGMGRSGTSALTRVLSLCGCSLHEKLFGVTAANPLGHWEPSDALIINDAFLAKFGSTWWDPTLRLQNELTITDQQRTEYIEQIAAFLRSLPATPLHVVKEPRITALSDFWFHAARQLGFSIRVVIPVRHPQEVASSLATRDHLKLELASALWLKYNLLAERNSRTIPRIFVEYTSLLRDWRSEISRIATALSIDLSCQQADAINTFLRQDLRRQRTNGQVVEVCGQDWISRVYSTLSAAARGEAVDTQTLDRILVSYRSAEHDFRVALDDFRAQFHPIPVIRRPYLTRVICAVAGGDSPVLKALVDSQWYRTHNGDVIAAGLDPYEHWLSHGAAEGRLPCADPLSLLELLMQQRMTPCSVTPDTANLDPIGGLQAQGVAS